jgi:hypothetical protein
MKRLFTMILLGAALATPAYAQTPSNGYSPAFGFPSYAAPGTGPHSINAPESLRAWELGEVHDNAGGVTSRNHK